MKTPSSNVAWLLALTLFVAIPVRSAVSPDFSDLWWTTEESGWGMNISQGDDAVMFATLVVLQCRPYLPDLG